MPVCFLATLDSFDKLVVLAEVVKNLTAKGYTISVVQPFCYLDCLAITLSLILL
jgi:hypothetical protein